MIKNNIQDKNFVVTIDTEADDAWRRPDKITLNNFEEIPYFQKLCEKYEIIPTYLLTYEYAKYKPAVKFFKRKLYDGKCEIGYHLHVWTTPPFSREKNGVDLDWLQAYQYELPDSVFREKADTLYETIYDSFKVRPLTHRAGRWGIDERTINWLIDNDFKVDTSVVPYFNMEDSMGKEMTGPNFENKFPKKYYWETSKGKILEVPVSVYRNFNFIYNILANSININKLSKHNIYTKKIFNKIFRKRMLRPNPSSPISFYNRAISNSDINNHTINMMLHSSELKINCSPLSRTDEQVRKNWDRIEYTFKMVQSKNIKSYPLSMLGFQTDGK